MKPVSIEGVRRNFGISSVFMYTVTLFDETEQRIFPVGIERQEALSIVAALHNLTLPRPQTINVMVIHSSSTALRSQKWTSKTSTGSQPSTFFPRCCAGEMVPGT